MEYVKSSPLSPVACREVGYRESCACANMQAYTEPFKKSMGSAVSFAYVRVHRRQHTIIYVSG